MHASGLKYREYYSTLLWLSISAIAYYLVHLKFLALDFHTRDYAFYTEFIIKWSGPVSEQFYSLNPGGYNFLGIVATDGCDGFYQWIHFEPIRFVQAFIYKLFHSLQAVFIFNCLLVCSPVLGITKWLSKTSARLWEYIAWVLLFVAFPATLFVAGYDNRPSMFLGVGYFWLLYSLLATKKTWLQFLFFVLLFSVREEALILNAFVLVYLFFQKRKGEISGVQHYAFCAVWIIYLIGLICYFDFWNYKLFQDTGKKYSVLGFGILGILLTSVFVFSIVRKKYKFILFMPGLLVGYQLFAMYQNSIFPDENYSIFNDPRWQTINLIVLAMLLYWNSKRSRIADLISKLSIPLLGIFALLSFMRYTRHWKGQQEYTLPVLELRKKIQPTDEIMTDYNTHQAFLGFKNLYCMDRLPCKIDKGYARFWPENFDQVAYKLGTTTSWFIADSKRNNELFSMKEHEKIFDNKFIALKYLRVAYHEN